MGLSSILERIFRVRRMVDPVYGPLLYQKEARFWEGWVSFEPTGGRVEVLIDGDEQGPTEPQRRFLGRLAERYPSIHAELLARAEAGGDSPEGMTLVCIDVPFDAAAGNCELSYESADGVRHLVVEVAGWAPTTITLELD